MFEYFFPLLLGYIGLYLIRIEFSGNRFLDKLNKNITMQSLLIREVNF